MKPQGGRRPLPAALDVQAARRPPRLRARQVPVSDSVVRSISGVCAEVATDEAARVGSARDWWPLAAVWADGGTAPALPAVVARPAETAQVADVLRICNEAGVPVTAIAGRSGVCGGSIPLHGGVSLDMTGMSGISRVDDESLLVDVLPGTFGDDLETRLRDGYSLTIGHWPQSVSLSTVGGWIACRGAGQYSTRYGKIEDMVVGLEVVLADGRVISTAPVAPRAATGPDLNQIFIGCEGTLGIVTEARLRARPAPSAERRAAYGFESFAAGLDACRRILRRDATPAVLRLYDAVESARHFDVEDRAVLVVVDEADEIIVDATMSVVARECAGGETLEPAVATRWLDTRNDLPALEALVRAGIVADTVEIAGSWAALRGMYRDGTAALGRIDGTIAASAHQSHAYRDGGCLYFTFAGKPEAGQAEAYYRACFDAVMRAALDHGGAVSHHHGVGLNRARYMHEYLGDAFGVLQDLKRALDPRGILNPGKLGLPSPFGEGTAIP